ncbi:ATP-binding protein [Tuwongella immobilis]|uniref:Helicase HerA central domain-containing protein n=1 Tax=Tuwongella immobilis TaxID=692036 RepID=A0A6C2YJ86_9BACT|nr:ATP-binding protein [Tuwongella immobilis]VIP01630.1 Uncharacterized protein OS=Nitrolancea hollandica Lb GN=NITHO_1310006 PE=4 SV=1: AAA_10 [Tuwongella immobilis]VTR98978.1 Uncharacterized protein OS=Nitrolancea hollandica Lb GN=NITHO_1310006 PE=4 SV=1: AAA_10 [Tuwongella immobilis]
MAPAAFPEPESRQVGTPVGSSPTLLGQVASPPNREATSEKFWFWCRPDVVVEKGQIVKVTSNLGGELVSFFGLTTEVYRQSRMASLSDEFDRHDGDPNYQPPFTLPGITFAATSILRSDPPLECPPMEVSAVELGGQADATKAYGLDEMGQRMNVGLIRNGAREFAGPGGFDLDYLLGINGGHLNVNGTAGRGAKSSFLLHVVHLLQREADRQHRTKPSATDRLQVVPIIFNVKGFDLFHIDRWNQNFNPANHLADWTMLGCDAPSPFVGSHFFAPQIRNGSNPVSTNQSRTLPYSWSLEDVIERGLFSYLFSEEDAHDTNFSTLMYDIESRLTRETIRGEKVERSLDSKDGVTTFDQLLGWVEQIANGEVDVFGKRHHNATLKKFARRLRAITLDNRIIRSGHDSNPLDVIGQTNNAPRVIDLASLANTPDLQRFVVATVFQQLIESKQSAAQQSGLIYLVMLDELNRFAPRGSRDPITRLIERVAAEMRSQGVILLGAQQQASKVSERVIENSSIRVLGHSGSDELSHTTWRFLSDSAKSKAMMLRPEEKLISQAGFREPLLVKIPFPAWALRPGEATDICPIPGLANRNGSHSAQSNGSNGRPATGRAGMIHDDL